MKQDINRCSPCNTCCCERSHRGVISLAFCSCPLPPPLLCLMSCYWEHFPNFYLCKMGGSLILSNWGVCWETWSSSLTGRWRKWWLEVRSVTSLVQLNLEKAVGVQLVSEVQTNSSASANSRLRSVLTVLSPLRALGIKTSCWCWEAGSSCIIDQWWIHRQISICFHVLSEEFGMFLGRYSRSFERHWKIAGLDKIQFLYSS